MRFDSKVSTLEERVDLATLIMDEIHGIFTSYEMRIERDNLSRREGAFKASKKTRKKQEKVKVKLQLQR
jgi:hypothetical protein